MRRLATALFLCVAAWMPGITVSAAETCTPMIYLIKGAAQSDKLDNGMVSELYGLVKEPYRKAGATVLRFPHSLRDPLHKQVIHDLKGGLFGTRGSDLVRSVAKTVHENRHNPVVLVGHSWGGASAYQLTEIFARSGHPDARLILVTLDPVSFQHSPFNPDTVRQVLQTDESVPRQEQVPHPSQRFVQFNSDNGEILSEDAAKMRIRWANVFATPKHLGCNNVTAQVGGWWGDRGNPDLKVEANTTDLWPDWYSEEGQDTGHCDVVPMYYLAQDFIIREIERTCGLEMPRAVLTRRNGKETLVFVR